MRKIKLATLTGADVVEIFVNDVSFLDLHNDDHDVNSDTYYCYVEGNCLKNSQDEIIGIKTKDNLILVNGNDIDEYHARDELQNYNEKTLTIGFECLEHAKINIKKIKVIDTSPDIYKRCVVKNKFKKFRESVPQGAQLRIHKNVKNKIEVMSYHLAGTALIKYGKFYYLCSADENSYFVSKLRTQPKTISTAFKSLKPAVVNKYEKENKIQVARQGEWFFLPTKIKFKREQIKKLGVALPLDHEESNKHLVSHYIKQNNQHLCYGRVIHDEHASISLEGKYWYKAVLNTALGSWSQQGVD
jgi:hypothetical protein